MSQAGVPSAADDVMLVTRARLSSRSTSQVTRILPASLRGRLSRIQQPRGLQLRNKIPAQHAKDIISQAQKMQASHAFSQRAADYLVGWASGTLVHEPRPVCYPWLQHRWAAIAASDDDGPLVERRIGRGEHANPVEVYIRGVDGNLIPVGGAEEEEAGVLMVF